MSVDVAAPGEGTLGRRKRSLRRRLGSVVTGAIGAVSGVAPHVLHHAGPIAGAALLSGAGGTALFAGIGFAVSVPFLLRLRRRFNNWRAPLVALAVFAAMFTLSALVIGPAIRGDDGPAPVKTELRAPAALGGHAGHH